MPKELPKVEHLGRVNIRPWDKLQEALPPLSSYEFEELKNSINQHGVLQKILVLPDGRIIDGVHRWKIAGDKADSEILPLDEDSAFVLGIVLNVARRNLTPEQLEDALEQRKKLALELRKTGKSQIEVAEIFGVDRSTVAKWENNVKDSQYFTDLRLTIPKEAKEEIFERAQAGETQAQIAADYKVTKQRIGQIIRQVEASKREPEPATTPGFPKKKYRCLVIDPPWPMEKIEREVAPDQGKKLDYPVMDLDEISDLPIPDLINPDGCHVYLWTTHKHLPDAINIFEKWGIRYECLLTWIKPTGFTPFSWMYDTEHILFGRGGKGLDLEKKGIKLSFSAPVKRHSEKPDKFYEIVRIASPEPRLEMFARKEREGFDAWGSEVGGQGK